MKPANLNFFFLSVIALNIIYGALLSITDNYPNSFSHFKWLLTDDSKYHDSWHTMISAVNYFVENPNESIYGVFKEEGIKFQYPPTSLIVFDIPERIIGLTDYQIVKLLDMLSLLSVFLIAYFSSRILSLALKEIPAQATSVVNRVGRMQQFVIVLTLTVLYYPLIWSYHIGQIQTILTFLITLSIFFWLSSKKIAAGVVIGLACLFKPQVGVVVLWAIIRRQWHLVYGAIATIVIGLIVSISLYGFQNHLDYLDVLSFLSRHGESYYPNQSINGLLNRLLFNGDNLEWNSDGFPPYSRIVHITTLLSSISILLAGLLWNHRRKTPHAIDLAIMFLCATVASPIAWEHHYGILLPIFVMSAPFVCHFYGNRKSVIITFALSFVLASQFLKPVNYLADTYFNPLQSYLFFSAIAVLVFLFMISKNRTVPNQPLQ